MTKLELPFERMHVGPTTPTQQARPLSAIGDHRNLVSLPSHMRPSSATISPNSLQDKINKHRAQVAALIQGPRQGPSAFLPALSGKPIPISTPRKTYTAVSPQTPRPIRSPINPYSLNPVAYSPYLVSPRVTPRVITDFVTPSPIMYRPRPMTAQLRPISIPLDLCDSSPDVLKRPQSGTVRAENNKGIAGTILEDYEFGKHLGQGAYAIAKLALHRPSRRTVAVKIYEKFKLLDPHKRKAVSREIRILQKLRHPNLLHFIDALDSPKQVFIVTEFIGGGSLHGLLKKQPTRRLTEDLAKRLFRQICEGLKYLHERQVIHRDIKLENILLDGDTEDSLKVKIIDFGFSTVISPGKKIRVFCGTPSYMAPEIVNKTDNIDTHTDVWAAGVVLFAMLAGSFPFKGINDRELYRNITKGVFQLQSSPSQQCKSLVQKLIEVDVTKRINMANALREPWLSDNATVDFEKVTTHEVSTVSSTSADSIRNAIVSGRLSRDMEADAIVKLEKLGYAKEDILAQLNDEESHLHKLYFRFLKVKHRL